MRRWAWPPAVIPWSTVLKTLQIQSNSKKYKLDGKVFSIIRKWGEPDLDKCHGEYSRLVWGSWRKKNFFCCYHLASPDSNAVRGSQISFTVIRGKRKAEMGQTFQPQGPQSKNSVLTKEGQGDMLLLIREEPLLWVLSGVNPPSSTERGHAYLFALLEADSLCGWELTAKATSFL